MLESPVLSRSNDHQQISHQIKAFFSISQSLRVHSNFLAKTRVAICQTRFRPFKRTDSCWHHARIGPFVRPAIPTWHLTPCPVSSRKNSVHYRLPIRHHSIHIFLSPHSILRLFRMVRTRANKSGGWIAAHGSIWKVILFYLFYVRFKQALTNSNGIFEMINRSNVTFSAFDKNVSFGLATTSSSNTNSISVRKKME